MPSQNKQLKTVQKISQINRYLFLGYCAICLNPHILNAQVIDLLAGETNPYEDVKQADIGSTMNKEKGSAVNLRQVQEAFDWSAPEDNVTSYKYDKSMTYKVRLGENMTSLIHLPKNERIKAFTLGDNYAFNADLYGESLPNVINIRGKYPGTNTNLNIIGESGRIYNFYLRQDSNKSDHVPDLTVYINNAGAGFGKPVIPFQMVSFDKAGGQEKAKTKIASAKPYYSAKEISRKKLDYLRSLPNPKRINVNYKLFGDKEIAPIAVHDDGYWTYFKISGNLASGRLPVPFKVVDGYDAQVNYRIENGFIIAESLSQEGWTLRNGDLAICVRPEGSLQKAKQEAEDASF